MLQDRCDVGVIIYKVRKVCQQQYRQTQEEGRVITRKTIVD